MVLLAEQQLRNLRMRLVHAYVMAGPRYDRYLQYLARNASRLVVNLTDALRCAKIAAPRPLPERLPIIAETLKADTLVLAELLDHRRDLAKARSIDPHDMHARLSRLIDAAISWIERQWPHPPF